MTDDDVVRSVAGMTDPKRMADRLVKMVHVSYKCRILGAVCTVMLFLPCLSHFVFVCLFAT